MPQTVLVTGGAGYLGSILCEHLLDRGWHVRVLDNLFYGQHSLLHLCARPGFDFVLGDARDEAVLAPLVKKADVIIPLAAIVGAPACDRDKAAATSINLHAVRLLLRLRSPAQLVVYPNTNSGYGTKSSGGHCTEETPLEPISLYGRDKVEAERDVLAQPHTITLRLATVFGISPRPRLDLLVNHFVYAAITDGYLVLFEKDFKRNYIHIRDVADCFIHCIEHAAPMAGRPYNAGLDDANLSKAELAEKIKQHVPQLYVHYAPIGSDPDQRDYIVSNQRLRQAGFAAKRSLDDGIEELLLGYRMLGRHPMKNV
jgi:nucleoside-diphosphate-sugar epimerase